MKEIKWWKETYQPAGAWWCAAPFLSDYIAFIIELVLY